MPNPAETVAAIFQATAIAEAATADDATFTLAGCQDSNPRICYGRQVCYTHP